MSTSVNLMSGGFRQRGRKELIHSVFLECAKNVIDEEWINLYEDLAYGKCPKGLFMIGCCLNSSNKKNPLKYNFEGKTVQEITSELHPLIIEKTTFRSERDIKNINRNSEKIKDKIRSLKNISKFSDIKKKKTREILLDLFMIRMKEKYTLTDVEIKQLRKQIITGFAYKYFASSNVIYKSEAIQYIKGLEFDKEKRLWIITTSSKLKHDIMVKDDIFLYKLWNKRNAKMTKSNL